MLSFQTASQDGAGGEKTKALFFYAATTTYSRATVRSNYFKPSPDMEALKDGQKMGGGRGEGGDKRERLREKICTMRVVCRIR